MPEISATEIAFWATVFLILYALKGYPILLALFSRVRKSETPKSAGIPSGDDCPHISFIVAAYNEEKNISAKLDNLLSVEYPEDKLEFIIGSDASDDDTDRILEEAAVLDSRIKQFRLDQRSGKIAVIRKAVSRASGSILVFTDCSVRTDADIMAKILAGFSDDGVGLISSRDVWTESADASPQSQHQYIDYEMKIRRHESRLNSLVSVSGSFFAIRSNLFQSYGDDLADDFALPLLVYRQGYRVVHHHDLIGYIPMVKTSSTEISRRTRIITAGIRTVMANMALLNPLRYPIFAWQLWSHKVLKWLLPFIMILNLMLAGLLWNESDIYKFIVAVYGLILFLGIVGLVHRAWNMIFKPFRLASFLLLSMTAALKAWYNVITGSKDKTWEPTHR